jgi:hypothetical protein
VSLPVGIDNRDIAVLFWLVVFLAWMLTRRDLRPSLLDLLHSFSRPVIFVPIIGLALYTAALALVGERIGIWEAGLVKETTLWFFGTGFVLLMNLSRVLDHDDWFQVELRRALRVAVVIDFFINLAVLPLPVELVLVPFLTLLLLMSAVGGAREDLHQAKGCIDGVLSFLGICLFAYVAARVLTDWNSFDNAATLESLLLPIWFTFAALPYIYALALWAGYQRAFAMVDGITEDVGARRRARLALPLGLGLRARELGQLYPYPARRIGEAPSLRAARTAVADFRAGLAAERQAVSDEEERLRRFAGVEGTDEEGCQLDQREFAETKEALQWISSSQEGWYSNPEESYRADLLALLEPFPGLPEEHGICLKVAEDGQSWSAWRRTATGWCFAIGAAEPPPDFWLFDGPEPPAGFPGSDPSWGERGSLGINW